MKTFRFTRVARELSSYRAFVAAKTRCTNPHLKGWARYGGRGIRFQFKTFAEFLDALKTRGNPTGLKPSRRHSLDRYPDPDGDYVAGNVRWATRRQQAANKSGCPTPAILFRPTTKKTRRRLVDAAIEAALIRINGDRAKKVLERMKCS